MWLAKIEFTLFASRGGQTFAVDGQGEKEVCVCFGDVRAMSGDSSVSSTAYPWHKRQVHFLVEGKMQICWVDSTTMNV